jgi:hypothetical protein
LQLLQILAKTRLRELKENITAEWRSFVPDPSQPRVRDIRVVPANLIHWEESYRVATSQKATDQISGIVTNFFEGKFVDGLKKTVSEGLNIFLGGEHQTGESFEQKMFVAIEHNALVRVDVAMWKYKFTSDKFIAKDEFALSYAFAKSIIDRSSVAKETLVFYVSKLVEDDIAKAAKTLEELKELWGDVPSSHVATTVGDMLWPGSTRLA